MSNSETIQLEAIHMALSFAPRFSVTADGTLTVRDVQAADAGTYSCTATNVHGSDAVRYDLKVRGEDLCHGV